MKSLAKLLLLTLVAILAGSASAAEHSPTLDAVIASTPSGQPIPVVLFLDNRLTMDDVYPLAVSLPMDSRRQYVIQTLQARFNEMGGRVMKRLEEAKKSGKVTILRPLWILNGVRVSATADIIAELDAKYPEVVYVANDGTYPNTLDAQGWGVADMQAVRVWSELGVNGSGVLVAHKDAGLDIFQAGFAGHLWINPGEDIDHDGAITAADSNGVDDDGDGYVDDFWGWDFDHDNNDVRDDPQGGCHGTRTASVISSTNSVSPCDTVSVAPGAKLMELSAWLTQGAVWEASQYALMKGAQVMSSSLSFKQTDCDLSVALDCPNRVAHRMVSEMELAAGMIHANSDGDAGLANPVPLSICSPADGPPPAMTSAHQIQGGVSSIVCVNAYVLPGSYANGGYGPMGWSREDICVHPRQAFCGAVGHGDAFPPQFNDYPYDSARHPGLFKPDISGPQGTPALSCGSGCSSIGGTSGATPHVAGALALIYSAFPGITPEAAYLLLVNSAQDIGMAGPDTVLGFGKVKPFPACSTGVAHMTRLTGMISGPSGAVADVRISSGNSNVAYSGPTGAYTIWLTNGVHGVAFEKYGLADYMDSLFAGGGTVTHNITMSAGSPAQVILTAMGDGSPQSQIPVSIPKIPLSDITGDPTGTLTVNLFAGRYVIIYGDLPWNVDTLVLNIPPGNSTTQLPLTHSPRTLPTGPDSAGYYIYDNLDTPAAAFEWAEINGNAGGLPGTQLATGGDGIVMQTLPFTFRYYGANYSQISVCANGFIVLGNYGGNPNTDWAPQPIPGSLAPNNYLAPFFEDWEPQNAGGRVLYYSQPDSHRVIIEWYHVQTYDLIGHATFEAILYDPAFVHTPTQDGLIRYQYNMIAGTNQGTIGIENLNGTDGLQYLFQMQYDAHASPIIAGRALLITTDGTLAAAEPQANHTLPREFALHQNYPNPFNPTTTFSWSVPRTSMLRLALYDVLGRQAAVVFSGVSQAGEHVQVFDGTSLATGVYFARLEVQGKAMMVKKVLLLK